MMVNTWSITLLLCAAVVLFLAALASLTAIRAVLFWDERSSSEKQLALESQTWLSAALIKFALAVQVISTLLLVLAADAFSTMISGAMCATGSFLANGFGPWALGVKLLGIYLYGFWIVLHEVDIRSERMSLVRVKFAYLLILLPVLVLDTVFLVAYLANLTPDIITSCCGVIFSGDGVKGNFFIPERPPELFALAVYALAVVLLVLGVLRKVLPRAGCWCTTLMWGYSMLWLFFLLVSLVALTSFFSAYIYALPTHFCPFDMLGAQYNYIGYPIYLTLFGATFLGLSCGLLEPFRNRKELARAVTSYQDKAIKTASLLLLLHMIAISYPMVKYIISGGES